MKLTYLAATAAAAMAATAAGATTIDFSTFADGAPVTSIGPVGFSLYGGPASGAPLVSDYWEDGGVPIELNNSPTGQYPTAEGIEITFAGGANNVSFTFDNYGYSESYEYALSGSTATDFKVIGEGDCAYSFCTVNVSGSDITALYIDNDTGGYGSWEFGVGEISYSAAGVPEPASWALMLIGFGGLGGALRASRRRVAVAA